MEGNHIIAGTMQVALSMTMFSKGIPETVFTHHKLLGAFDSTIIKNYVDVFNGYFTEYDSATARQRLR